MSNEDDIEKQNQTGSKRGYVNPHIYRYSSNVHPSFFPSTSPRLDSSSTDEIERQVNNNNKNNNSEIPISLGSITPMENLLPQVGTVYACGLNNHGQLGLKDYETRIVPTKISATLRSDVQQLAAGSRFSLCLTSHGQVYAWGKNEDGQCGQGSSSLVGMTSIPVSISSLEGVFIVKIAARGSHALALARDGKVYAWGKGDEGQLGIANSNTSKPRPVLIEALANEYVVDISAGRVHSVAVTRSGMMYTWGSGEDGATGLNTTDITLSPTLVDSIDSSKYHVDMVACGSRHTLCVASERGGPDNLLGRNGRQTLFVFGSNSYGQLGLNDTMNRFIPTPLLFSDGNHKDASSKATATAISAVDNSKYFTSFSFIACGYRHSCVVVSPRNELWCFGWNAYGQTGTRYGITNVTTPSKVENLPKDSYVQFVAAGGRHTLVSMVRNSDYKTSMWAFGKGDEGALGTGDLETTRVPREITSLSGKNAIHAACGWSHSLVAANTMLNQTPLMRPIAIDAEMAGFRRNISTTQLANAQIDEKQKGDRWEWYIHEMYLFFSIGNIDGAFAQFLNTVILFLLMQKTLLVLEIYNASGDQDNISVSDRILPAAAATVFASNLFYALWAGYISHTRRIASLPNIYVTALPHGLNTVIFFAFATSIILPVLEETKSPIKAYRAGLFSCFVLGILELPCVFFVETLRKHIPRAALMSAIGGVALVYIAMSFALEIFELPIVGIIPFMIILVGFAAGIRFPFRIPAGFLAMALGTLFSFIIFKTQINNTSQSHGSKSNGISSGSTLTMDNIYTFKIETPTLSVYDIWESLLDSDNYKHLSIIFPMLLVNLVSNLSCVESAESLGDSFDVKIALFSDAFFTIFGAIIGNPVPTCLYLGFPAFKSMGSRTGYSAMNGFLSLFVGMFNGISFLGRIVPEVSGVGMLLWIGIMVVTQAFHQDERQQYQSHAAAVAFGILPALAAWAVQLIKLVLNSSRDAILQPNNDQISKDTASCDNVLAAKLEDHLFEQLLIEMESRGTHVIGMISLSKGWLLSCVFLASTITHVMEREFFQASLWMVLASILSLVGFVHAFQIDRKLGIIDYASNPHDTDTILYRSSPVDFFISYLGCAIILMICEIRERDRSLKAWGSKILYFIGLSKTRPRRSSTAVLAPQKLSVSSTSEETQHLITSSLSNDQKTYGT